MNPAACFALLCFLVALVVSAGLRGSTMRRLQNPHACRLCGYSRSGLPDGAVCPECGATSGEVLPRRSTRMLIPYAVIAALPVIAMITCWAFVADFGAAGIAGFAWTLAGAGVALPLRAAEASLRPERAMLLMIVALTPMIGVFVWSLGYCALLLSGSRPPGEYGLDFDVMLSLGVAGPILALNGGNWACVIACAVIAATTRDPARPMRSPTP
jgi:hypothetical protein